MNFRRARQGVGKKLNGDASAGSGKQQAEKPPSEREQNAFGQQLADHPGLSGAERSTNCKLAGPASSSNEQQVGDICAGDEENEAHRGEKDEKEWPNIADDIVFQRVDGDATRFVDFRIGDLEIASNGVHI